MKNPYYMMWSDAIQSSKKHHPDDKYLKPHLFLLITFIDSLALAIVTIWLKYFNIFEWPLIHITFLPGTVLNKFSSYLVSYAPPFVILNYFLIFHKDRYKKIIKKYPHRNGNFFVIYCLSVLTLMLITVFVYGLFLRH